MAQRLVRICGEVRASPAENDEIQFIVSLCSLVKTDPSLVNFFIEVSPLFGLLVHCCFL